MIAVHLHPPVNREPDYVINSPSVLKWWEREGFVGGSVLVQYEDVRDLIRYEPGNEALKLELIEDEPFTMATLTQVA